MDATCPADFVQAKERQEMAYLLLAKVKKKANLCITEAVQMKWTASILIWRMLSSSLRLPLLTCLGCSCKCCSSAQLELLQQQQQLTGENDGQPLPCQILAALLLVFPASKIFPIPLMCLAPAPRLLNSHVPQ